MACAAGFCFLIGLCRIGVGVPAAKWVGFAELVTIILYLGVMARECASCWQDGIDASILPLILLGAAAFAVRNGAVHGARSGAALLWFIVPGVCLVLFAGISELNVPVFVPLNESNPWITAPLFLLPFLSDAVGENNRKHLQSTLLIGIFALLVTLWLNAEQISEKTQNAFYEYSKGITLFGVAERFEAVSACLLTAGWFALFSFLLARVFEVAQRCKIGAGIYTIWTGAAVSVLVMYKMPMTLPMAGVLCVISWGILPLGTQVLGKIKKSKKREKNP